MHHLPNFSYRSLEFLCRKGAALASTADTRREMERLALEYKLLADWLDRQPADTARGSKPTATALRPEISLSHCDPSVLLNERLFC
jgi:hypothetical protein